MTYRPGLYKVVTEEVRIRREPRILSTNIVGRLKLGTERNVYDVTTDANNMTWGKISESDATGNAQWVCIEGLNRKYMQPVLEDIPIPHKTSIEYRLEAVEAWARTKGYTG